jgi:1-deoxy-D-xylulose-5-phosphate synthase
MTPSDEQETRLMLSTGFYHKGPAAIRYPRGTGPDSDVSEGLESIEIGQSRVVLEGSLNKIFLNFGALLHEARDVCEKLDFTLIDMRFVKPLDKVVLKKYLKNADLFVSLEDGSVAGGAGSAVLEFCSEENIDIRSKIFGIPDKFIEHASREEMIAECGLDSSSLEERIKKYC